MGKELETEACGDEIYLAGERVSAGLYRQIGASRIVRLEQEGCLPAGTDGRVACYCLVRERKPDARQKPAA